MLSRRSVRVKVMQLLFALGRDEDLSIKEAKKLFKERVDMSFELFLFNLYCIVSVTKHSEADAAKRKTKHIPSDIDAAFTSKIYNNEIIQDIVQNKSLNKTFQKHNFEERLNMDYSKKIYDEFVKTDEHTQFILAETSRENILEILLELYRFCRQNEFFNDTMEETLFTWIDDKSLVVGVVKKYLKSLPSSNEKSYFDHLPSKETIQEFGEHLFDYTQKHDEELLTHIKPVLENWDHERLAIIDMILLKMAIAEFFIFPTIPHKVTINEYVEVAKKYSTAKSKDFINGILDKLSKELDEKGLIKKEGRGLIEE